jgi:outer membrane murein-binding lipoprotein Lpp
MRKINIITLLMICLSSLLLTGCKEIGVTPEIDQGNSGNQVNSGNRRRLLI